MKRRLAVPLLCLMRTVAFCGSLLRGQRKDRASIMRAAVICRTVKRLVYLNQTRNRQNAVAAIAEPVQHFLYR